MYVANDIWCPIGNSDLFQPSHLCWGVYMYPSQIGNTRRLSFDSNFFTLGGNRLDEK